MFSKFERKADVSGRNELHCAACKRVTIHNLEARCIGRWSGGEGEIDGAETHSIYRCGGCDEVCFQTSSWNSYETDYDEDGKMFHPASITQYPPPVSAQFNFNLQSTPEQLNAVLDEMLYAMAGNKLTLATIGLRLAIEFITKDTKCTGRGLVNKIDDLKTKGLIDDDQQAILHKIRIRGNAGAHDAKGMKPAELVAGMSIIEGLLEKLYNGPARHADTIKRAKQLFPDEVNLEEMLG